MLARQPTAGLRRYALRLRRSRLAALAVAGLAVTGRGSSGPANQVDDHGDEPETEQASDQQDDKPGLVLKLSGMEHRTDPGGELGDRGGNQDQATPASPIMTQPNGVACTPTTSGPCITKLPLA